MSYCGKCGVEIEERLERCPLCRGRLQAAEPRLEGHYPSEPDLPPQLGIPSRRVRMIVIEVFTVLMFGTLFGAMILDYLSNHQLTWSIFCAPGLAAAWWYAWLLLFMFRRPAWLLAGSMLTTTALLAALDMMTAGSTWFFGLALPILLAISLLTAGIIWISCFIRTSWANLAAMFLLAVGLLCLVINVAVNQYQIGMLSPTWALPVLGSVTPPALFLLYVHYRLSKMIDLEKIFHL